MSEVRTKRCDEPDCGVIGMDVRSVQLVVERVSQRMDLCPQHFAVIDEIAKRHGGWQPRTSTARIAAARRKEAEPDRGGG
jgi:3-hydroxyacyl-CoA dehydrogenase